MADGIASLFTSPGLNTIPDTSEVASVAQPFAGYVGNMLGNAQALANAPMPAYTGQLTAGPSALQQQAFSQLANNKLPTNLTSAGTGLGNLASTDTGIAANYQNTYTAPTQASISQYMNPYVAQSLQPQLELLQQQLGAQDAATNAKLAQAGAFGGGRQAVANAQNALNSNLLASNLIGQGYNTAYNTALNAAQNAAQQQAQANQFGGSLALQGQQAAASALQGQGNIGANEALYGLANINALANAGGTQQGLNQAALNAQYNQYLNQLQYPQQMLKLQSNLLQGLPLTNKSTYSPLSTPLQEVAGAASGLSKISQDLQGSGVLSQGLGSILSGYLNGNPPDASGNGNPPDASGIGSLISNVLPTTPTIMGADQNAANTAANAFGTSAPASGYMSFYPSSLDASTPLSTLPASYDNAPVIAGADKNAGALANNIFGSSENLSLTGQ
jgi:hypothetical protein